MDMAGQVVNCGLCSWENVETCVMVAIGKNVKFMIFESFSYREVSTRSKSVYHNLAFFNVNAGVIE